MLVHMLCPFKWQMRMLDIERDTCLADKFECWTHSWGPSIRQMRMLDTDVMWYAFIWQRWLPMGITSIITLPISNKYLRRWWLNYWLVHGSNDRSTDWPQCLMVSIKKLAVFWQQTRISTSLSAAFTFHPVHQIHPSVPLYRPKEIIITIIN